MTEREVVWGWFAVVALSFIGDWAWGLSGLVVFGLAVLLHRNNSKV